MEKDASYLSDDGFSYNNEKKVLDIGWISYPHFFQSQNWSCYRIYKGKGYIIVLLKVIHRLTLFRKREFVGEKFNSG